MASVKVLSATLLANHNTVQITDNVISNSSIFEIYVSDPDLICNNIVVGGTTANITFDSKPTSNTPIKILVNNIDGNFTVNASDVVSGTTNQDAINTSVSTSLSGKVDTTTLNERVPSETVLGGVLYHGTTGNEWKVLSGANVNYDSNTTVNEKLNECFTSVSSGKSLLADAITDKGVETSATDTFQTMATNISNISSGKKTHILHNGYNVSGGVTSVTIEKDATYTIIGACRRTFTDGSTDGRPLKNGAFMTDLTIYNNTYSTSTQLSKAQWFMGSSNLVVGDVISISGNVSGQNAFCVVAIIESV